MKPYGDTLERQPFTPRSDYKTIGAPIRRVSRPFYDLGFSTEYKVPLWTAYQITPGRTRKKFHRDGKPIVVDRSCGSFCADPKVPESPPQNVYDLCGYDTGHMIPAEAMQFDRQALSDTFFTSNACPQTKELNRGPWRTLERDIFNAAIRGMQLTVISGPIFAKTVSFLNSGVAIPDAFFKIAVAPLEHKFDCWTMCNDDTPGVERPALQDIARATGLSFPGIVASDLRHIQGFMDAKTAFSARGIAGVKIENLMNGEYTLLEDFIWDPCDAEHPGTKIRIPAGFTTDFGSVPGMVQNIYPPIGTFRDQHFLGHDWLYGTEFFEWDEAYKKCPTAAKDRSECDWRLLEALKASGDSWFSRNVIWSAVKAGGGFVWAKHNSEAVQANRRLLVG